MGDASIVLGDTNSFKAAVKTVTRYIREAGNSETIDTKYSFNDVNSTWGRTLIVLVSGSNDYGLYLIGGYSGHIDVTSLKAHSSLTSFSLDNNNHLNVTVSGTVVVGIYDNDA